MNYEHEYLYCAMKDPTVLSTWPVPADWFGTEQTKKAFEIWHELAARGALNEIELLSVLKSKVARDWFFNLQENRLGNAEAAATGLGREYARRQMKQIGLRLAKAADDRTEDPDDHSASAAADLAHVRSRLDGPQHIRDVLTKTMQHLEKCWEKGGAIGLETGFVLLDAKTGGLEDDKLYLVGARPKAGKTAFALQVAAHVAEHGQRVYFASREMGSVQLGTRLVSMTGGINGLSMRSGKLDAGEWGRMKHTAERLLALGENFVVDTRARLPFEHLRASILREHSRRPIRLVCVDYIQLLRLQERHENRAAELEVISYNLKNLAREIHAPVLCLAQLNREQEENKPPAMDKLKGSGGLEQAADVVLLLWKPEPKDPRIIEAILAANRDGPTGKFRLSFQAEFTRFE